MLGGLGRPSRRLQMEREIGLDQTCCRTCFSGQRVSELIMKGGISEMVQGVCATKLPAQTLCPPSRVQKTRPEDQRPRPGDDKRVDTEQNVVVVDGEDLVLRDTSVQTSPAFVITSKTAPRATPRETDRKGECKHAAHEDSGVKEDAAGQKSRDTYLIGLGGYCFELSLENAGVGLVGSR